VDGVDERARLADGVGRLDVGVPGEAPLDAARQVPGRRIDCDPAVGPAEGVRSSV
jgi:hypothetical protein